MRKLFNLDNMTALVEMYFGDDDFTRGDVLEVTIRDRVIDGARLNDRNQDRILDAAFDDMRTNARRKF